VKFAVNTSLAANAPGSRVQCNHHQLNGGGAAIPLLVRPMACIRDYAFRMNKEMGLFYNDPEPT